jgi:transposase
MSNQAKKQYSPTFKLKVVLESMQRDTMQEEVCRKFGIVSSMLHRWRKEFQEKAEAIFLDKRDPKNKAISQGFELGESPDDLKKLIGELTVQNAHPKKKLVGCWAETESGAGKRSGEPLLRSQRSLFTLAGGPCFRDQPRSLLYPLPHKRSRINRSRLPSSSGMRLMTP